MALSFLRTKALTRYVKNHLYQSRRSAGYIVLIPEFGEEGDQSNLLAENGLPEFSQVTIEKCIATVARQSFEYDAAVKNLEETAKNCQNVFTEIFQPIEQLDTQLELTWGIAKTLYLGNSSLMPTASYIKIHEQAHRARSQKFDSKPIFDAAINEKNHFKKLTDEEDRLLNKYILEGKLNGLEMMGNKKDRIDYLRSDLNKERNTFREKVKMSTSSFTHYINEPEIVKNFPITLLKAMSITTDPEKGPWKVTLQPHVYEPFMQYCPVRDLRWNAWEAHMQRCSAYGNKQYETSVHLERIRSLRHEQATTLGFESFSEMSMETKMAGTVQNVYNLLDHLLENAKPMQDLELESLQNYAKERKFDDKLEYWDIPYWQRKQRFSLYNYDENRVKEYFPLNKVVTTAFNLCSSLFNIQIVERPHCQTWHKDVKFYDIYDKAQSPEPISGFYLDPYARQDLKIRVYDDAGWHITIQNKCTSTGSKPLSALIFNFQAPEDKKPSLLTFNEVKIFFQRFGHALRHLLTQVNYSEVAGLNNVEWDAADVCGKVMTHWLTDAHTIRAMSGHYESKEPLPDNILDNLLRIQTHMAGYKLCNELYLSRLDLQLHAEKTFWRDVAKGLWPKYHSLPFDKYNSQPLSFTKIFSEEWAAAYYSGIWSQMIAADIYSAFEEARQDERDIVTVGKRYKDTFLALGGGCHPSEVFRRFRGRDPSPQAMLQHLGLTKKLVE